MSEPDFRTPIYAQILGWKQRKSDLRRMAILQAAIECLGTDGIAATTLERVARKAKMRRSHVAYYFKDVPAMIEAAAGLVIATSQELNVAYLVPATDPPAQLRAYIEATFAWFERYPLHAPTMAIVQYYGIVDRRFRHLLTEVRDGSEARLTGILRSKRKASGRGRPAVSEVSRTIRGLLMANLLDYFSTEPRMEYQTCKRRTIAAIEKVAAEYWG